MRRLAALCATCALFAAGPALAEAEWNPIQSKQKEHEALLLKLKRDIFKVDRSILETEKLIAKSRNAPYLPDLQFRLAELYVEKSRYVYYQQAESRPEGAKGAIVSPETKLLKEKAIQIYSRLLREHPDFHDADKVTFYLAHEQRELGLFAEMLKTLGELIRKYPDSPLRLEAEQILGDYFFDKADLAEAEKHYQVILEAPPSPVHDLARYKMGWIRINQGKHADAVTYFEAAAASAPVPGVDAQKALNVKREALLDLVYSYTEARPAKGAINYFEKLSDSRATFALALDKLGTRYFIKQQYEYAIPALRKLLEIVSDPELDLERAEKIYDSLKAAKGKVLPEPEDIHYLVRAAVEVKTDPDRDEAERKKILAELEEMGRDLATTLHTTAQKKDDVRLYAKSADAYREYLSLFRPKKYVRVMMRNRADALFAAKQYPEAARQFEELAHLIDSELEGAKVAAKGPSNPGSRSGDSDDGGSHESALYGALLSHFTALKKENVDKLDAFEVADARQALKLLGAEYVSKYPQSDKVTEVKFNIARAYYDDGEFDRSAELFTAFALGNPTHKDATVAGHLALDSYRQLYDFKGLEEAGKKFIASKLPPGFIAEVKEILTQSRADQLGELALRSATETGDVVEGLIKVADENKGAEIGEKALYGAFTAAREKRDFEKEAEIGQRFVDEYPKSQYVSPVLMALGRHAAEVGRFQDSAQYYELLGQKLGNDGSALDGWLSAARLRMALADTAGAVKDLERAADIAGKRKSEVLTLLATTWMKAKEPARARAAAEQALALDKLSAEAGAIVAEVAAQNGKGADDKETQRLIDTLTTIAQGPNGQTEETAKGIWYLAEILYRKYKALPSDQVEEKVAMLQQLEGLYTQAASLGSAEYAVASLWRLGTAYQHLADVVEATPLPEGASAAEIQQFRAAVKEQVAPVKQRAESALQACLSRAESLEVFTPAVLGCRTKSDTAKVPIQPVSPKPTPAGIEELQRKAEQVMDAASMEALGLAWLEARQLPTAQLVLGRATELEDTRASAHNALGLALLLSGDAMGARAAYGKALDADPTYEKARVNLAALRCRFGDVDGARRELAVIKDTSGLSGPDVDPEWKTCR
ncbi:MAG: tetratricopeptide repeat protein [Myxococcaceae bacterium]|nr:tetratricopeptide repeat protein [Myxococcaceae bacterium]